jgi:hypothetical protein
VSNDVSTLQQESETESQQMTSVTVRNIPSEYRQKSFRKFLETVDIPFNFLYLPNGRKNTGNAGWCCINFYTPEGAKHFLDVFDGYLFEESSEKMQCAYSKTQGLEANVKFVSSRAAGRHVPFVRLSKQQ